MSTMKGNLRRTILTGVIGTMLAVGAMGTARADFASDKAAAIIIYPKIVVDTSGVFGPKTNTEIQLTNTSNSVIGVRCFLVDATAHCSDGVSMNPDTNPFAACTAQTEAPGGNRQCDSFAACGPPCGPSLSETDFKMTLTKRQPVSWNALDGLTFLPLDPSNPAGKVGKGGQSNAGSSVPQAKEDPFVGTLTCVEVDPSTFLPISGFDPTNNAGGDLKGEATIISEDSDMDVVDARKYNAIGLQSSIADGGCGPNNPNCDPNQPSDPNTLLIGGPDAEYTGCPNVLILDTLFDDATVITHSFGGTSTSESASVRSDLTIVPCGEDFNSQTESTALLQILVFNEFEQRLSTSTRASCFRESPLSDLDTPAGTASDPQSIFNVALEGTLAGQARIRTVEGANAANGVVGIVESFFTDKTGKMMRDSPSSAAGNLHFTGSHMNSDTMALPAN